MVNPIYLPKEMPEVSVGACINSRNCKAFATDLANGWCVNCWDKGPDAKKNIEVNIKRREEKKELKGLLRETRGRHKKNCTCEYHKSKGFV